MVGRTQPDDDMALPMIVSEGPMHLVVAIEIPKAALRRYRRFLEASLAIVRQIDTSRHRHRSHGSGSRDSCVRSRDSGTRDRRSRQNRHNSRGQRSCDSAIAAEPSTWCGFRRSRPGIPR